MDFSDKIERFGSAAEETGADLQRIIDAYRRGAPPPLPEGWSRFWYDDGTIIDERVVGTLDGHRSNEHLTKIQLGTDVTEIGGGAFYESAPSLETAELPESLTAIGFQSFYGCVSLKEIEIPAGVKSIDGYAFYSCGVSSVVLHEGSLRDIGSYAFDACEQLTSISVPNCVKNVGENAFMDCHSLISAKIGNGLNSEDWTAAGMFGHCSNLEKVVFENGATDVFERMFSNCGKLSSVSLPNSISSIKFEAFEECSSLSSYSFVPSSVKTIGSEAFKNTSLTGVNFSPELTSIGELCFAGTKIKTAYIPNTLKSLGDRSFYECAELTSVQIGNGIAIVPRSCFYGCTKLKNATIGSGVTEIALLAFENCSALQSITIPSNVAQIGQFAFRGTSNLMLITMAGKTKSQYNNMNWKPWGKPTGSGCIIRCTDGDITL